MDEPAKRSTEEGALMSGAPDYANPFLAPPVADFDQRPAILDLVQAPVFSGPSFDDGQLLTPAEQARLATAPKRPAGTEVTVRARPVGLSGGAADHMFAHYDDGQEQYIFRGGPTGPFLHAQVDPAADSPDYAHDSRVLYQTYVPGVRARDAIRPAQARATQINGAHAPYLITNSNSNSVIGDFTQDQFGRRVGDDRTWGYQPMPTYPMTQPIW
jgi:hypothetical protein